MVKSIAPLVAVNYSTVIVGLLLVVPALVLHSLLDENDIRFYSEVIVGTISTVCILSVVYYHLTTPPHPKFVMNPIRKFCIRVHVIFGTLEVFVSIAAIILGGMFKVDVTMMGKIQAVCAVMHVLSAMYQTPIVFGAKAIMIPGYYYVELFHAYFAVYSWLNQNSLRAIINTYFCLNIFTYVRVYIKLMFLNNIARGSEYSIASILATITILPYLMGPGAVFFFMLVTAVNGEVIRQVLGVSPYHPSYTSLIHEHDRYVAFDKAEHAKWRGLDSNKTDRENARDMFDSIDTDKSNSLDSSEVVALLSKFRVAPAMVKILLSLAKKNEDKIGFDTFYRYVWKMRKFQPPTEKISEITSDEKKCRVVFDSIDADGSGTIDTIELAGLLSEWGCPDGEIDVYLKKFDENGDGQFSFEEFYKNMRDMWLFGFESLVLREVIQTKEDIAIAQSQMGKIPGTKKIV